MLDDGWIVDAEKLEAVCEAWAREVKVDRGTLKH